VAEIARKLHQLDARIRAMRLLDHLRGGVTAAVVDEPHFRPAGQGIHHGAHPGQEQRQDHFFVEHGYHDGDPRVRTHDSFVHSGLGTCLF
jgi:hypothetical protein